MIGSLVLSALVFSISNSMYSIVFDVLIEILKDLSTYNPNKTHACSAWNIESEKKIVNVVEWCHEWYADC